MADTLTPEYRSWVMSRIRSRNTKPELIVRMLLHRLGYRFSLRRADLPGTPDIVLPKYRTVVFVHGCFWHRHPRCNVATMPKSRVKFWRTKFTRNVARDEENKKALRRMDWHVLIVWECQILKNPVAVAQRLDRSLRQRAGIAHSAEFTYVLPSRAALLKVAEQRADYNKKG